MRPRQTVVEQFSSLARMSDRGFHGWLSDPRLQRSMQRQLQLAAESPPGEDVSGHGEDFSDRAAERYWSIYWHQSWQAESHRLAESHLAAYLQEPCFWVAQEVTRKVTSIKAGGPSSYTMLDYFQMALTDLRKVLAKFSPERSSNLKAFAQTSLSACVKSTLRQRHEVDFCTPWGLLRKTSKKRLLEVLKAQGLNPEEVEQARLLMQGFGQLYVPPHAGGSAKLPEPDAQLWQALADFYNQQRLGCLSKPGLQIEPSGAKLQVNKIARWIRQHFYPPVDSLNRPRGHGESEGGELLDTLSETPEQFTSVDLNQSSLIEQRIAEEQEAERHQSHRQVHQILEQACSRLDQQTRTVLDLLYSQGLSQTESAEQLKMSQATVSRRAKNARKQLRIALLDWAEQTMNKKPGPDQLTGITNLLEEWLKVYLRETDF